MARNLLAVACVACVWAALPGAAPADEVDDLVRRLKPPARFRGHTPRFSVEKAQRTFEVLDGPRTLHYYLVKDAGRCVAYVPIGGGAIHVLDFNPQTAPKEWRMPPGRPRIETMVGTALRTDALIPSKAAATEATYRFTVGDGTLTLVRRWKGTATFRKWTYKGTNTVDATNTFVFRCDPVLGYVVQGTYDGRMKPAPKTFQYFSLASQDMCNVWAGKDAISRAVITPAHKPGFEGYSLNFPVIDWCDNDRTKFRCRDGGFAAFLNRSTGWSPAVTLVGCECRFVVCNAHADLDFVTQWPDDEPADADADGMVHRVVRTRMLALPPEVTRWLWGNMSLRFTTGKRTQIRLGVLEDFEDQPLPLTTWWRALTSTGGGPEITEEHARSGKRSAVIRGRFWPNLPQVPLEPDVRYRLEAHFQVVPWSDEERRKEEVKARARIEKLRQRGKPAEDFRGFGEPQAYITGHLYQHTPHNPERVVRQQTSIARPGGGEWQKVSLEFTAPTWGPFIDFVFVANACTAYMDDFRFQPVGKGPGGT